MKLTLSAAPATLPVTLDEAKLFARIDLTAEDALTSALISAATARLDGRDGLLGRALITQTWIATYDSFPRSGPILVPLPPCQSVTSVTYLDTNGATQTLDPTLYRVAGLNTPDGATIERALNASWPATAPLLDCITITFVAGYGAASAVPDGLKTAIKVHVSAMFEGRESSELPMGYDDLILPYRSWRFA